MKHTVVTGLGVVSALGLGKSELRKALGEGRDGIRPIAHFDTSAFQHHLGATVPGFDHARDDAAGAFGLAAAREALAEAGGPPDGARLGLVVGTSLSLADSGSTRCDALAARLAESIGAGGPVIAVTTACTSSTHAIGIGMDLIAQGDADVVLAGGVDELTPELFAGFSLLGALSPARCAPFSLPLGTTLGEGAAFLVLEAAPRALARGARIRSTICGYGLSCDARHETAPDATGQGVARAVAAALAQGGAPPGSVDYVNAHGTGTAHNDPAEWKGLTKALGARDSLAISSSKGTFGHAQGAAGALEVAATLLCLEDGRVPPTHGFEGARNLCPADPVGQRTPRPAVVRRWVSTNSAFWGANAALVLDQGVPPAAAAPAPIHLAGAGLAEAAEAGDLRIPGVDGRTLDESTRLLTLAVVRALGAHGPVVRAENRERIGLFVGALQPSLDARDRFASSVRAQGLHRLSTEAFTRMVSSAIGGGCARALGLRGAFGTLASGAGSGVVALGCAAAHLARHPELSYLVAAGVDEPDGPAGRGRAVAVLLGRGPGEVQLSWALAGRARIDDALARLGDVAPDPEPAEDASVCGTLATLVAAVAELGAGATRRVIGQRAGATTAALRIERRRT